MVASVAFDILRAARWRRPRCGGSTRSSSMGRTQRAALMRSPTIIIAPSCIGLFLKKMLSISRYDTSAFSVSPLCTKVVSSELLATTMSAPVLVFDILRQARQISCRVLSDVAMLVALSKYRAREKRFFTESVLPNSSRNLRISCWKRMMTAITPTLMNESRIVDNRLRLRNLTTNQTR